MEIKEFKLERFFGKYEFTAPYLLCCSDCESFAVSELLALEKKSGEKLDKLWLGYTESQGNPALRQEISRLYRDIKPEEIIVTNGAEEGIFIFMNALLKGGDHILVQYPAYQSLYEIARSIGCEIIKWEMDDRNDWKLDFDFPKNKITEKTKTVVINSPHNPTGYLIPKEELNELTCIAKKSKVHVFSDESYRFSEYQEKDRAPSVCEIYDKGVSLGGLSKAFGLSGLRIGWIATRDKKILQRMLSFKDFTTMCCSAPSEFLSILALRHREYLIKRNLEIIEANLNLLDKFFEKYNHLFEWKRPAAGPIAFPRIKFDRNAGEFCKNLLDKKGVLLAPSTKFDFGNAHFRIGFGRKNMLEALEKLGEYLKENF
ncbi:MAG TPA: aminotransferase class I/II-fold pyridoxal phosphate-dependent enzyme [Thermoplasmata archaeon]|nr:aminotransferase class I/II-fold pyridoxal phosphate-dependent enzyme [Thermoplasmata archaeon]